MRVTLVQPPSGLYDTGDLAPPLGLLTLAAFLEQDGLDVSIVDMNLRGIIDRHWVQVDFYKNAVQAILATNPDIVGFTSMALESHLCLEMARQVKASDSGILILLGGPHFSAIAKEVLDLYSWVDFVVMGEGERATSCLLRRVRGLGVSQDLVNVARRVGRDVVASREFKPLATLEDIPFPAYHLVHVPSYFTANPSRLLDYEHGRGCIFRCAFCYSPVHWGQGSQVKKVDHVVDDVIRLKRLGARHLFFVQDNFPNSVSVAKSICEAIGAAGTGLTWNCYATLPHLTTDFLDSLAMAGCTSVFVGVDAVSNSSKKSFLKHFYKDWTSLATKLQACLERGIVPTCAFMIDPPLFGHENTDAALTIALFARTMGCGIRLNTLTLYNQSATAEELRTSSRMYTNLKPLLLLDTPAVMHDNQYARQFPNLFPFHNTHLPLPLYRRFVRAMHVAYTLFSSFYRTLTQYVLVDSGSLWQLLDGMSEKLGALESIHPVVRRPLERELFVREFGKQHLSRQTRSAMELDVAEYHLACNDPASSITILSQARRQTYQKGKVEIVNVWGEAGEYEKVEPMKHDSLRKTYLLVRRGEQVEYFTADRDVLRLVDKINTHRGAVPLRVPVTYLDKLIHAGILH